jgi:drug/metabolite transporter (DMT)-like permease
LTGATNLTAECNAVKSVSLAAFLTHPLRESMLLIISLRVLLSVSANAIQKRLLLDGNRVTQTWILTYAFMLPIAIVAALFNPTNATSPFWRDILIGGFLDAIGNLAMVAALRGTDISIFGPLNAIRPIIALLSGWIFLAEAPTAAGLAGIAITIVGALILFGGKSHTEKIPGRELLKLLLLRAAGISLGAFGAVFLKRAALTTSAPMTVAAWIACGLLCLLIVAAIRVPKSLRDLAPTFRQRRAWLITHSLVFITMQWLTIVIFQKTLLAYAFVFFQLALVLQVIVGRFFFNEPHFRRRMIAAIIMSAGSGIILWKG